jgi:tetratricopeptide (TPR) repeat protein
MFKKFMAFFILVMLGVSFAQKVPEDSLVRILERAKAYYNGGEYEYAIKELEKALQYLKQLKQVDQVEAYKYLAFSYVAFGDRNKAKETFKKALALDPQVELDPATVSPKIIKVFEEAKSEMAKVTPTPKPPVVEPEKPPTARAEVSTFSATWRSCCLPGWGQMYKGDGSKGKKIMIAAGLTGGLSIISITVREITYNNYLDADPHNPDEIKDAYNLYKFWHNATVYSVVGFLGIYVYNLFDVAFTKPGTSYSMIEKENGIDYSLHRDGIKLGYKIKF